MIYVWKQSVLDIPTIHRFFSSTSDVLPSGVMVFNKMDAGIFHRTISLKGIFSYPTIWYRCFEIQNFSSLSSLSKIMSGRHIVSHKSKLSHITVAKISVRTHTECLFKCRLLRHSWDMHHHLPPENVVAWLYVKGRINCAWELSMSATKIRILRFKNGTIVILRYGLQ